jgi:hypothetical protein
MIEHNEKQKKTKARNFKILRLRGLYAAATNLLPYHAAIDVHELVDKELEALGAETEIVRRHRLINQ